MTLLRDDLIRLYDNGTNGDVLANDGIYSRSGITASGLLTHDGGTHQRLDNQVIFFAAIDSGAVVDHLDLARNRSRCGGEFAAGRGARDAD